MTLFRLHPGTLCVLVTSSTPPQDHPCLWCPMMNICEIIQTSDGYSRHLETYYGLIRWLKRLRRVDIFIYFFYQSGTPTLEKCRNPWNSHLCHDVNKVFFHKNLERFFSGRPIWHIMDIMIYGIIPGPGAQYTLHPSLCNTRILVMERWASRHSGHFHFSSLISRVRGALSGRRRMGVPHPYVAQFLVFIPPLK
jgi:hypothetical protein